MAGIGFELKKLFSGKGILATIRAYGYAGMVCAGPMLLGVALQLGIMFLATYVGVDRTERELLVSMITYALLASLTVTSFFSMITTRYTADLMFEGKHKNVMPSFFGSISIMLIVGGIAYGIFLCFSGVEFQYKILSFIYFCTLIVTWTEINYLTALKDYKNIMLAFSVAVLVTFLTGFFLIKCTSLSVVTALFIAVCVGYGMMMVWYFILIYKFFPEGFGSTMGFLRYINKFPHLFFVGFFLTAGLFGHLVIIWSGPIGVQIKGLFYGAPQYDVAALIAFFSILVTTINFVTSVEVRFYPQYRSYFSLFNNGGSIEDIENREKNMLSVLRDEISYLAQKQAFITIIFIVLGSMLLPMLPLGFNSDMLGIFRVLCVGYALYAIGNSVMLISLYFADNKGAFFSTLIFAITTNLFTMLLRDGPISFYGFGFLLGSGIFCIIAFFRLDMYISKLKFHVLAEQPVFEVQVDGILTRLSKKYEKRAIKKQRQRKIYLDKKQEKIHSDIQQ